MVTPGGHTFYNYGLCAWSRVEGGRSLGDGEIGRKSARKQRPRISSRIFPPFSSVQNKLFKINSNTLHQTNKTRICTLPFPCCSIYLYPVSTCNDGNSEIKLFLLFMLVPYFSGKGEGDATRIFRDGVPLSVFQTLLLFQTKCVIFHQLFSGLPTKIYTRFETLKKKFMYVSVVANRISHNVIWYILPLSLFRSKMKEINHT